ncbi:MAG: AarF/ABC1/UbiB kinase family protein [Candidatus Omnitrophica bacterium]|nr:AarF/ABC1/UbiB kinase family protein [Candidatus Omnitrophota bacterium]
MLFSIKTMVGDINRLRVILVILFEEGFGFLIDRVRLAYLLPFKLRLCSIFRRCKPSSKLDETVISLPERLCRSFQRLGPTYVKFGQILSLRSDIIPPEYIQQLEKLQTNANTFSYNKVKEIVAEEFGKDISQVYKTFSEKPFAAASLAQVHNAELPDGTEVAVKVQRPDIRGIIENDIHILFFFAALVEKYIKEIIYLQPVQLVKEFSEWTMRELDFSVEAANAERFRQNFADDNRFYFPEIHWDYSTKRVLTMELIKGIKLSEAAKIIKAGGDPYVLAINGLELGLRQFFIHGFFQADPHPGNFFVLKDNVLCLYDFGMVGYLDRQMRDSLSAVFISFVEKNAELTSKKMLDLAPNYSLQAKEEFAQRAMPILSTWFYSKKPEKSFAKMFYHLVIEGAKSGLYFPRNLVLCSRALLIMEGTGLKLCPEFKLYDELAPLFEKVIKERFNPKRIMKDMEISMIDYLNILQQLPENTLKLIEKIEKGQIDVKIDKSEIMAIKDEMERVNNIRLISIVIITLLVTAAIILRLEQQTLVFGLSVAKIALILCLILSVWLISIIRKK